MPAIASRRILFLAVALLAAGGIIAGGVVYYRGGRFHADQPGPAAPLPDDPRITFQTPFKNVRPGVAYVGDAACVECHQDIGKTYRHHPMGRAMDLTTGPTAAEPFGKEQHNPFEKFGYVYRVEPRDGKVYHHVERHDEKGKIVADTVYEAKYAVGSGTRGKSYVVEMDGRLFQSPISWFGEKKIWDISPGYAAELNFNRPVNTRCMACHCNYADEMPGTLNGYKQPVFRGFPVGCERCHGPGELHVKRRESGERIAGLDDTIVNPKRLEPALRESVCEQCHLQGAERVLPRGRAAFDFRPGLPLETCWTVFVRRPEQTPSYRSVGQVEQLHRSKCFEKSGGQLGCISCHNPHRRPDESERVAFFRGRCLSCHENKPCSVPVVERTKKQADDSCIACHMSREGSSNIPHVAVTDHRILRTPDSSGPNKMQPLKPGEAPVVPFHTGTEAKAADRDLGVALATIIGRDDAPGQMFARMALPLLDEAVLAWPDDEVAWEARGVAMYTLARPAEALMSFEKAIALKPNRERSLIGAATACLALEKSEAAIGYWRRAIEVDPFVPKYHIELARLHVQRREWPVARSAAEAAIRLESINVDARMLLVQALIRLGERQKAQAEFDTLMAMRPPNEADLRRLFATLMN